MKKTWTLLIAAALTATAVIMVSACAGPVKSERELKSATDNLKAILQSRLSNLNNAVSGAADKIAANGLQGGETREILDGLCRKYPYLIDCSAADPSGRMVTVAPEAFRRYEGAETATTEGAREFLAALSQNRKPALSRVFRAVEGVDAVVLTWPVVTGRGEMLGSVSALFKPEALLAETIDPAAHVRAIKVNVAQTDGLTIYCSSGIETGKNLLTDERYRAYPELLAMGEQMVARETGTAVYSFLSDATGQPVRKTAYWTTIGLHGTQWRLVSMAELGN